MFTKSESVGIPLNPLFLFLRVGPGGYLCLFQSRAGQARRDVEQESTKSAPNAIPDSRHLRVSTARQGVLLILKLMA